MLSGISSNALIILAGDLNINYLDQSCPNVEFLKNIRSYNIYMHVNQPTRITSTTSTMIDYVCSTYSQEEIQCSTVNAGLSDHEAVYCLFPINSKKH